MVMIELDVDMLIGGYEMSKGGRRKPTKKQLEGLKKATEKRKRQRAAYKGWETRRKNKKK